MREERNPNGSTATTDGAAEVHRCRIEPQVDGIAIYSSAHFKGSSLFINPFTVSDIQHTIMGNP